MPPRMLDCAPVVTVDKETAGLVTLFVVVILVAVCWLLLASRTFNRVLLLFGIWFESRRHAFDNGTSFVEDFDVDGGLTLKRVERSQD